MTTRCWLYAWQRDMLLTFPHNLFWFHRYGARAAAYAEIDTTGAVHDPTTGVLIADE